MLSQWISGIALIGLSLWMMASGFFHEDGTYLPLVLMGLVPLGIGLAILLNRKEDTIEAIRDERTNDND